MTRSVHDAHFTAKWVAQCARHGVPLYPERAVHGVETKFEEAERVTQRGDSTVICRGGGSAVGDDTASEQVRARAASPARVADVLREAATARSGATAQDAVTRTNANGSRAASLDGGSTQTRGDSLANSVTLPVGEKPARTMDHGGRGHNDRADKGDSLAGRTGPHQSRSTAGSPPDPRVAPSKYRNIKTDGYASKREARRAKVLYALQAAKVITNLRKQVPYVLIPRQLDADGDVAEHACSYIADFVYTDNGSGLEVVEDCKGMRTREYVIKRKLMRFAHGIVVRET